MNFLQTIKNSIYSPSFYQQAPQRSFWSGLGYFLLLVLLLTVIKTAEASQSLLLIGNQQIQSLVDEMISYYPEELEVKISRGQVTTNVQEPYFIKPTSSDTATKLNEEGEDLENIVVIDTKTPFSAAQFNKYNTTAWLTKDSLFYKDKSQIKAFDLTTVQDFTLNKEFIDSWVSKISPYFKFVGPVLILFAFLGIYFLYTGRLIYLLILAFLVWILLKLLKKPLTYSQSYKVGLFAMTLPLLLELLLGITDPLLHFQGFPFMFTVATLIVVTINFIRPPKPTS